MFDVAWTDPKRETVGQRKNRKEQQEGLSRRSSIHSSRSSDSQPAQIKPSLLNLFGGSKRNLPRIASNSKLSVLRSDDSIKAARRVSSYTVRSDGSALEQPDTTTRIPVNGYFTGPPYHSDAEQSTPSEGMISFSDLKYHSNMPLVSESVFSGWTDRSRKTESTWSSVESTASSGRVVQSLSPKSFITQSTEVTVSPRDSVKAAEQVARVVHISSAGTVPTELHESRM